MSKTSDLTRVVPIAERSSPKDRQLAALRTRIKGSDAYLNVVAELAYGSGKATRLLMEAR